MSSLPRTRAAALLVTLGLLAGCARFPPVPRPPEGAHLDPAVRELVDRLASTVEAEPAELSVRSQVECEVTLYPLGVDLELARSYARRDQPGRFVTGAGDYVVRCRFWDEGDPEPPWRYLRGPGTPIEFDFEERVTVAPGERVVVTIPTAD